MKNGHSTEILLIRHARIVEAGRLIGKSDADCERPDDKTKSLIRSAVGEFDQLYCSPAKRCQHTTQTLFPDTEINTDARLWEQNFGDWEMMPLGDLPDIGELSTKELSLHTPPNGESFMDVYNRVVPVIIEAAATAKKSIFVVHAGVIRALLGKALSTPEQGLLFNISNLSMTSISCFGKDSWSINYVNRLVSV
ncbi:MAG: histidine phosphatase family protein [Methyloligellaceae bacterium]